MTAGWASEKRERLTLDVLSSIASIAPTNGVAVFQNILIATLADKGAIDAIEPAAL